MRAARLPPNRSISQAACSPAWWVVATAPSVSLKPRLLLALASSEGSSAASALVRVARACSTRERAEASVGLACWAASSSWARAGSSQRAHQEESCSSVPPWDSGACHWGGASGGTEAGGVGVAQAVSARLRTARAQVGRRGFWGACGGLAVNGMPAIAA